MASLSSQKRVLLTDGIIGSQIKFNSCSRSDTKSKFQEPSLIKQIVSKPAVSSPHQYAIGTTVLMINTLQEIDEMVEVGKK